MRAGKRPAAGERGQVRSAFWPVGKYRAGQSNPNRLRASDFVEMEKDPQVRAGYLVRELLITAKPPVFNYKPKNPRDPAEKELGRRMVGFLQWQWEHLEGGGEKLIHDLLTARRFAFAILEKVMASGFDADGVTPVLRTLDRPEEYRGFVYLRRIKLLPAQTIEPGGLAVDEYGNIIMVQQTLAHYPRPAGMRDLGGSIPDPATPDQNAPYVIRFLDEEIADRLIVYAANKDDDSNPYGRSDHVAAYNEWYSKGFVRTGMDQLLELLSGNVVGTYTNPDSQEAITTLLKNLGIGGQVAVPEGSTVEILQGWEGAIQQFLARISHANSEILRAYLVPELSVGGNADQEGSNARAASDGNTRNDIVEGIKAEIRGVLNEQLVKPLIRANFGDVETYPTVDFPPIAEKDRAAIASIISQGIRDGYLDPVQDFAWMRRDTGVPDDAQDYDAEAASQRKAAARPDTNSGLGLNDLLPGLGDLRDGKSRLASPDVEKTELAGMSALEAEPVFAQAESGESVQHALDTQEARLRSDIGAAARAELGRILDALPTSSAPEDLAGVRVDAVWYASVLDELADVILDATLDDFARKLRLLGANEAADRVEAAARALDLDDDGEEAEDERAADVAAQHATFFQRFFRRRHARKVDVAAEDAPPLPTIEDALAQLNAYRALVQQRNGLAAQGYADSLQTRLRQRILQATQAGLSVVEIARAVEDEFTSYTSAQLRAVATTTVFDYYNTARDAAYDAAGDYVLGKRITILLDKGTTPFCRDLEGRSISKTDPLYSRVRFPAWYGCRTITTPILAADGDWEFDTDWMEWIAAHRDIEGGGFWYASA